MQADALQVLFLVLCKVYTRQEHLQTLRVLSLDGTLIPSYEFLDTTGYSGKHRRTGVKVSALVDRCGVPLAFAFASGNVHDLPLAFDTLDEMPTELHLLSQKVLLADRAYDSFPFRLVLKEHGIEPHITKRTKTGIKPFFQDHYPFDELLAKKRFVVERSHAWLKSNRRLRLRYDYSLVSFQAFVFLAAIVLCVRHILA
jgi:transposase